MQRVQFADGSARQKLNLRDQRQRLDISDQYHEASWRLVKKIIENVSTAALWRFASEYPWSAAFTRGQAGKRWKA